MFCVPTTKSIENPRTIGGIKKARRYPNARSIKQFSQIDPPPAIEKVRELK
jgi:hypothetical protein